MYYQNRDIKYCEKVYDRSGKIFFGSIQNSCDVLNELKSPGFCASSLSTCENSSFYTTLPHNLIKDKLVDLKGTFFQHALKLLEITGIVLSEIISKTARKKSKRLTSYKEFKV